MEVRLQELTERIYQEGISKGQEDARQLVSQAQVEAEKIIADAKKQAEQIIGEASQKAAELQTSTTTELKLASNQAIESLKQEVINLVCGSITTADIKSAMSDKLFIQKAIESVIKNWAVHHHEAVDMKILIPENDEVSINEYFAKSAKDLLNKGFAIETVKGLKSGFQLVPSDGGYKISFTDQDFINFFQEFLRPKIVGLLFKE